MLSELGNVGKSWQHRSSNSNKGKVTQHHQNTMSVVEGKTKEYQDENKKR
jgi:hypothetical protein